MDIQLVPTESLIDELSSRYNTFIMAGVKVRQKCDYAFSVRVTGDAIVAMGLCEKAKMEANKFINEESTEINPDNI